MLPIIPGLPNPISIFGGFASSAVGWAWDKVVQGIFTWFAEGLLLLIEWVWSLLDTTTTPRLTDAWFVNGVVAALVPIALFVTVAMMLMSGTQAALSGRPELIIDTVASTVRAIAGTAFTLVVVDTLVRFADVIADTVWVQARPNTREVLDGIIEGVLGGSGWGATFLGPLALLIGMIGMIVTAMLLFMRSALLYFVAAYASLMWSSSILPMMRGSVRRTVHIVIGLILAKPAIVISLAIGMQLIAASPLAGDESGSGVVQLGTLLTGFFCFAVASLSPFVIYKLLPAAEGAAMASGIAGGWARSAMTMAQGAMMMKSFGAAHAASAATKAVPAGTGPSTGSAGFSAPTGGVGGGGSVGSDGGGSGGGPLQAASRAGGRASAAPGASPNGGTGANTGPARAGAAAAGSSTAPPGATPASSPATAAADPAAGSGAQQSGDGSPADTSSTSTPRRVVITSSGSGDRSEEANGGGA